MTPKTNLKNCCLNLCLYNHSETHHLATKTADDIGRSELPVTVLLPHMHITFLTNKVKRGTHFFKKVFCAILSM